MKYIVLFIIMFVVAGCIKEVNRSKNNKVTYVYDFEIKNSTDQDLYAVVEDGVGRNYPAGILGANAAYSGVAGEFYEKLVEPIVITLSKGGEVYENAEKWKVTVPSIKEDYNNKRVVINITSKTTAEVDVVDR